MQKEVRFIVDKWDSQIIIKPLRVVINRFRRNPGLGKKVSDLMVKGIDDGIVDPRLDPGFIYYMWDPQDWLGALVRG